jgi:F420H(2)-dependent quinone reductase
MSGLFPRILRIHQWIYEHTDGLLGHRLLFGNPTLLLRTTGRRTGLPRTTGLTYARDGDDYLVVASNGGPPKPPTWLGNRKAQPNCEIQVGRRAPPRHRPPQPARRPRLCASLDHRRHRQQGPIHRIPEDDGPHDPHRRTASQILT